MLKKIIIILLLIFVSLFCCAKISPKTKQSVVLQYASWGSESEVKILKPIIKDFENENPNIKIEFLHIPQNYFQKIHLLFASNTSPDIIFINNQYLPIYANAGMLEDLSEYSEEFQLDKYYKQSLDALSWNNKLYALPRDISNLVVYYNKDIFDKNNVKYPSDNWTLDDLVKISTKLTNTPEVFGISFDEEPLFYLPYLTAFGLETLPDFEDKTTQQGLKFYADLRNKYHVAPLKTDVASATTAQMFLQGRLAMQVSGRWLTPKYRQEADFRWDIVNFPSDKIPLDASGWAISKSSKNKKDAVKFISYLSSRASSEKFTQSGLIVPARKDVANSKVFFDGKAPQNANAYLLSIEKSVPTVVSVNYREVLDNLKIKTENMFNEK